MNYFYTSTSKPLHYYTCGNLMSKDGFLHHRRTFDCHVLILVLEGTLHITQSDAPRSITPGQSIFLKAGEEHYGHKPSQEKLAYLWVHFSSEAPWETMTTDHPPALPEAYAYFIPEHGTPAAFQRISLLFRQLVDYSRQETHYTDSILDYALSLLAMEMTQEFLDRLHARKINLSPLVTTVMEWIRSNCHKPLSLHEIAEEFHYNAEYLSSLFKKESGMTMIYYLNKSRVDISKNLLSSNNISIKEAAYSCGFRDEKYFMKLFKKYEGMTPVQYKNAFHH